MNKAKRLMAILLMIAVAFTFTACGDSQKKTYESASNLLNKGKYAEAAEKFEKLGSYEDASQMTMYAKALNEAESGNYEVALKTFDSLGAFKDAPQMISYYTARKLEDEGEYESASKRYNENPLFKDSQERSLNCLYLLAEEMNARERYFDAIVLYQQLGDYKDSRVKAAEIRPHNYEYVESWEDGYFAVGGSELGEYIGFIDINGTLINLITMNEINDTSKFSDGLARVEKDSQYGFIDTTGKLVVPYGWDFAFSFSDGLACVEKDDKRGFIDTTGKLVIPCEWDYAFSFSDGLACVEKGWQMGIH